MTGDAPQPGETPHAEGNPWSFDPDAAWWRGDGDREQAEALAETAARPRHPRRRPASGTPASALPAPAYGPETEVPFLGETLDAHAAGVQDAAEALAPPAALVENEQAPVTEGIEADAAAVAVAEAEAEAGEPVAVERDHDTPTRARFHVAEHPEQNEPDAADPDLVHRPEDVPDVMVMPEPDPNRNRPTVPIERGSRERGRLPGQPSGQTRKGRARAPAAELNVKRARMENSPFWLTDQERAAAAQAPPAPEAGGRPGTAPGRAGGRRGQPPRSTPRSPRGGASGLFGLMALGLIAAFFSWVSAEPIWLAVGHGERGVATVARCTGAGVTQRCAGSFTAAGGGYPSRPITLLGVDPAGRHAGAVAPARMVNASSKQAYVGTTGVLVHLRWMLGVVLVLLSGLGIAGLTGTRQLETLRARRGALLMSLAGPVLLLAGFLFASY